MSFVRVTIVRARGSVPRDGGTTMAVSANAIRGTIGGGALEWAAMAEARAMLSDGRDHATRVFPLGPALGQCCGGAVTLDFRRIEAEDGDLPPDDADRKGMHLWIWGAGHVGRALVSVIAPLDELSITWIDIAAERFPEPPSGVACVVATDMPRIAPSAPPDARHLIVTHSHEIDLALCNVLLQNPSDEIGLIGSATKWARFRSRLRNLGHDDATIDRIRCPIGQKSLGKHPQAIAVGVAADILAGQHAAKRMAG